MKNALDKQYQDLLQYILTDGYRKQTRNGETLSIFGYQILHNMKTGFPLLTTKKMAWKTIVTELMWFLRGDTNIRYLVDNDCHIWDGDAYAAYVKKVTKTATTDTKEYEGDCDYELVTGTVLEDIGSKYDYYPIPFTKERFIERIKSDDEFAKKWGQLGPIYGRQWRRWKQVVPYDITETGCKVATVFTDQIAELIEQLKTNPDSRRLIVSAWNVGELDQMALPPCHYGFQCWTREENGQRYLSLMWNQRSVDTFLGLPFNIASYGLLLEILAKATNMIPEDLIGNLGDVHLYANHIEQAKEQISREPYPLPKLVYDTPIEVQGFYLDPNNFKLEGYQSHSQIKAPLSN